MLPAQLNHGLYKALFKPRAFDGDRWSMHPLHRGAMICAPSDLTHRDWPRHLHIKNSVELSPTRIKLKEEDGFIRCIGYKG